MRIVVALGGNALLRRGEPPEAEIQRRRLRPVAEAVAALAVEHEVLIVHGNGPQVGLLALESGADPTIGQPYPLGDLVAESQGLIGSWIQQALLNRDCSAAALVTQVVVDAHDPAFIDPSKPIGAVYSEATAHRYAERRGWRIRPDGGGDAGEHPGGHAGDHAGDQWRRVVPSPRPTEVVGLDVVDRLVTAGHVVVVGGGGGVPLVRTRDSEGRVRHDPVEAVVDKDLVAAIVADRLDADVLAILTDVEGVLSDFGTPDERLVPEVTAAELLAMDLPAGSMRPKAEACASFVRGGDGRLAVVGALERLVAVSAGEAGTRIVASAPER